MPHSEIPRYLSRGVDYLGDLGAKLRDLQGVEALVNELVQNADDANATKVIFDVGDEALYVKNNRPFSACADVFSDNCSWTDTKGHRCDFHRFRLVASGDKRLQDNTTGAFGVGFTAVYQITDQPELISNGQHWIIHEENPESQRIVLCTDCALCRGHKPDETQFIFWWAFDGSTPLRRRLRLPPVGKHQLQEFNRILVETLPVAMLFLRHITHVDIFASGNLIIAYERVVEDNDVIIAGNKETDMWHVFHGAFSKTAEIIKNRYPGQIEDKRSARVTVALQVGYSSEGRYCAGLPTMQTSRILGHVNAEFFTKTDRKSIILDGGYQTEWNNAAIRSAAETLSEDLPRLLNLLEPEGLWDLLSSFHHIALESPQAPEASYWESIAPRLQAAPTVLTSRDEIVLPSQAKYITIATPAFWELADSLGMPIVHQKLRRFQNVLTLTDVGVKQFSLSDLAGLFTAAGLTGTHSPETLPEVLHGQGLDVAWQFISGLVPTDRSEKGRILMRQCSIVPCSDGLYHSPTASFHADPDTMCLFNGVDPLIPFAQVDNDDLLNKLGGKLWDVPAAITRMENLLHDHQLALSDEKAEQVLSWFFKRSQELATPELKRRLSALPLFPSNLKICPLVDLLLPDATFTDEMGIASLVDIRKLTVPRDFLQDLGAKEINVVTFVTTSLLPSYRNGTLSPEQKQHAIAFLARHLGTLQDSIDDPDVFAEISLAECTEGHFHRPQELHFSDLAVALLGTHSHYVKIPIHEKKGVIDLYKWLGVHERPSSALMVQLVRETSSSPPTDLAIKFVYDVIEELSNRFKTDDTKARSDPNLALLRNMAWLPCESDMGRWWNPHDLFLTYQKYLFASQGAFLAMPKQNQHGPFLEYLGLNPSPPVRLVVNHLIYCIDHGESVNEQIYLFLTNNAGDPTVGQLLGKPWLRLDNGHFVSSQKVFWSHHPFGNYRWQLDPRLNKYRALFDRLKVKETPDYSDTLSVLGEISAQFTPYNKPLTDEAFTVVMQCWEMLEKALEDESLPDQALQDLGNKKVVPNRDHVLYFPTGLIFEDRASIPQNLTQQLGQHLIPCPAIGLRAMHRAGVRWLSKAMQSQVISTEQNTKDFMVASRILTRRNHFLRILASADVTQPEHNLNELKVFRVSRLSVEYQVPLERITLSATNYVPAYISIVDMTLYYVPTDDTVPWSAVAREMSWFLASKFRAATIASGFKDVLVAQSDSEASTILDDLGYPRVDVLLDSGPKDASNIVSFESPVETNGGCGSLKPEDSMPRHQDPQVDSEPRVASYEGKTRSTAPSINEEENPEATEDRVPRPLPSPHSQALPPIQADHQAMRRTYVRHQQTDTTSKDPLEEHYDSRNEVAERAVSVAAEYEISHGRTPDIKPHNHRGYDIESLDIAGQIRYIEVKGTKDQWGRAGVEVTAAEFGTAQEKKEAYWLYVVEFALSPQYQLYTIQNPARVDRFVYDNGWSALTEHTLSHPPVKPHDSK